MLLSNVKSLFDHVTRRYDSLGATSERQDQQADWANKYLWQRDYRRQTGIREEVKNKLSSGEFKRIQNEGESTVWRYFCLVVNADLLNLDGWGREMNVKTDKPGQRQKHLQAENNGFQT